MNTWFKGIALGVVVAVLALAGCSGAKHTVRVGFVHDALDTDADADISGWSAGGTIGIIARDGIEAIETCGLGQFAFGDTTVDLDEAKIKQGLNRVPLTICSEFPVGG